MKRYVLKRVIMGVLTIFLSFCITFFLIRYAPGNPIKVLAGTENPNPELIEHLTVKYGLDKPLYVQFAKYIGNALKGDLGYSYISNMPVLKLIGQKVIPTLLLTLTSAVLAVIIGTILGIFAAKRIGSLLDRALCGISYVLDSLPSFWLGLMLILIFASTLKLFPTSGMTDRRADYTGLIYMFDVIKHLFLPSCTLILIQIPIYFRISRTSILQTMSEDFVLVLRATCISEKKIFNKYILRNAIIPTITIFGSSLAFMIGGVTLIEIVFAWPGMGRLVMDAIVNRDYPLLTGIYLMLSISICVVMIVVDIVYAIIDPRIRFS